MYHCLPPEKKLWLWVTYVNTHFYVKCVSFLKFNDFVLLLFQYGEIEEMNVCDNLGDHLVGNVYIKVSLLSV